MISNTQNNGICLIWPQVTLTWPQVSLTRPQASSQLIRVFTEYIITLSVREQKLIHEQICPFLTTCSANASHNVPKYTCRTPIIYISEDLDRLFGFPTFPLWAYLMKVIPETKFDIYVLIGLAISVHILIQLLHV